MAIANPFEGAAQSAAPGVLADASTESSRDPQPEDRVRQLAHDLLEVAKLPSFSVALLDGTQLASDTPSMRFAIGHENLEEETPATPETRYRAASVSKLFTATVLARLVESNTLQWDTPVTDLVPSFPDLEGATLRQLAGHLAGVAHYRGEDRIERFVATPSVRDALAFFRDSPRVGPPGGQMHYTTHGYTLLSAALEAAAEAPFLELVAQQVSGPLGLTNTGPAWLPQERSELDPTSTPLAELYMLTPSGARPFPKPESATFKWGGGGLATTPTDLVLLARAYLRPAEGESAFLGPQTVEAMWTSQTVDGEPTGTGIGWRVGEDDIGRPVRHHAGSMQGARSVLMVDPERRDVIAVMTNASWNSAIETTALLLLDAWRLPAPTTTFEGSVTVDTWIESRDGTPGERTTATATWRDGALDLPSPDGMKQQVRSWNTSVRIRPIAEHPDFGGRWAGITARGAGPGSCEQGDVWSCRFRLTHDSDLRVEWRTVSSAEGP